MPYDQDTSVIKEYGPIRPGKTTKKRNLVTLNTPLIIQMTDEEYEDNEGLFIGDEVVVGDQDASGKKDGASAAIDNDDDTKLFYTKINKSYKQILDACLMDRTIKVYQEDKAPVESGEAIHIIITTLQNTNINFDKLYYSETEQTFYMLELPEFDIPFYALDPNVPMTTINPFASTAPLDPVGPVAPNPGGSQII